MYIDDIEINGIYSVTFIDKNKALITLDVDSYESILEEIIGDMIDKYEMSPEYISDVLDSAYKKANYNIYGERK